jgi:hypothetical protein
MPGPRMRNLPSALRDHIRCHYKALKARERRRSFVRCVGPGLAGALVVELDEELHLNRHRQATPEPYWTAGLPSHDDYLAFSVDLELDYLAAVSGASVGPTHRVRRCSAGPTRRGRLPLLGRRGAKQRTLYDAINDAAALTRRRCAGCPPRYGRSLRGVRLGAVPRGER